MVAPKELPSSEFLHECFSYHEDGYLIGKERPLHHFPDLRAAKISRAKSVGKKLGYIGYGDYLYVKIGREYFMAHRIIYAMHHGVTPVSMQIDHIDKNRLNNRIENLRLATQSENQCNVDVKSHSISGIKGIYWDKSRGKWRAVIAMHKKTYSKRFLELDEATNWLASIREKLHGEFASY